MGIYIYNIHTVQVIQHFFLFAGFFTYDCGCFALVVTAVLLNSYIASLNRRIQPGILLMHFSMWHRWSVTEHTHAWFHHFVFTHFQSELQCDAVLMTVCCVVVCQVQRRSEGAGFIHQACRSSSNVFAVISGWPHWPVHHHPAAQPPLLPSSLKTSSIEIGAFQLFLSPCSCFISAQFDKLQKMTMLHFPLVFLMLTLCSVQPTLFFVCT